MKKFFANWDRSAKIAKIFSCEINLLYGIVSLGVALGLTVTEINIKKEQKQEKKSIRDACQKVCKQGRDGIKVKVNIQSPISYIFLHYKHSSVK